MGECVFCNRQALVLEAQSDLCFAIRDKYPVAPFHTLIIPKRCMATPFELTGEEQRELFQLAHHCSLEIAQTDNTVGGFNFGANIGRIAGQKIMHVHFHLIPRRIGDVPPPAARDEQDPEQDSGAPHIKRPL